MSIDLIVPLLEQVVHDQKDESGGRFFSYRHAQEMHALGVKHEFASDSPWSQVCVSIVVTAVLTPKIWVQIYWSRPKLEYPKEESVPWEFPLSEVGVGMFAKEWPAIRKQLGQAIARGRPPEKPNQPLQPTAPSRRG
jgi:hypothetical protein